MKLFDREKRIYYLGFDDKWFMVIGMLILSFVTDYLFSYFSFGRLPFLEALISWSVSLFFTILNWLTIRGMMIQLRKRLPGFKQTFIRILLLFAAIVFIVFFVNFIGSATLKAVIGINFNPQQQSRIILPIILISTMTMAIYEAIYNYIKLKQSIRVEEQAKQAIVQAQLDALRNQAQPHFFFNTLNTLRDIIDQNSKEEAKDFVDKISDVYRFILDSGNANLIPLEKELRFAQSYIHIQSERFGENLEVKWNISPQAKEQMVVPMSLQLLLENAIKHNVVSKSKKLIIEIKADENQLIVANKINLKSSRIRSTELGLENIKKRYQLISNEVVQVQDDGENFIVIIPLLGKNNTKLKHADTYH